MQNLLALAAPLSGEEDSDRGCDESKMTWRRPSAGQSRLQHPNAKPGRDNVWGVY